MKSFLLVFSSFALFLLLRSPCCGQVPMCEFSSIPPDCPQTIGSLQYGNLLCSCPTGLTFVHTQNCAFAVRAGIAYCFDPDPSCPRTQYATSYQMCCSGCSGPIWEVTMDFPHSGIARGEMPDVLRCPLRTGAGSTSTIGNRVSKEGSGI